MKLRTVFAIAGIALAIYGLSASVYPVPFGDADELVMSAVTGGIPHPSGYGVWRLLLAAALRLPLPLAYAAKIPSMVVTAGVVALVLLIVWKLTKTKWAAFIAAAMTIIHRSVWWGAVVSEKYPLLLLLYLLFVYVLLTWPKKATQKRWWILGVVVGGAAAYHPMGWLLPIIVMVWRFRNLGSTGWVATGLGLLTGTMAFISPLAVWHNAEAFVSSPIPASLTDWWQFITRGMYRADGFVMGVNVGAWSWATAMQGLWFYLQIVWGGMGWIPGFVGVYGLWHMRKQAIYSWFLVLFLLTGPLWAIGNIAPIPPLQRDDMYGEQLVITQRLYGPGEVVLLLLFGYGWTVLWNIKRWRPLLVVGSLGVLVGVGVMSWQVVAPTRIAAGYQLIQRQFTALPQHAVVVCRSDFSCYGLFYQLVVEKSRPDVTLLPYDHYFYQRYFASQVSLPTLPYPQFPEQLADEMVAAFELGRRVFVADMDPVFMRYVGLGLVYTARPFGDWVEVVPQGKEYEEVVISPPILSGLPKGWPWYEYLVDRAFVAADTVRTFGVVSTDVQPSCVQYRMAVRQQRFSRDIHEKLQQCYKSVGRFDLADIEATVLNQLQ